MSPEKEAFFKGNSSSSSPMNFQRKFVFVFGVHELHRASQKKQQFGNLKNFDSSKLQGVLCGFFSNPRWVCICHKTHSAVKLVVSEAVPGLEQDQDVFHFQEDGYLQPWRGAVSFGTPIGLLRINNSIAGACKLLVSGRVYI